VGEIGHISTNSGMAITFNFEEYTYDKFAMEI